MALYVRRTHVGKKHPYHPTISICLVIFLYLMKNVCEKQIGFGLCRQHAGPDYRKGRLGRGLGPPILGSPKL